MNVKELADLLVGRKAIGSKWVFKIKYKSGGEIERFKARLVAKDFNQREGIDFHEIFSLVVKIVTGRCLINLAVQSGWSLFQMDINNAFLYGELNETVYMTLPPGYFSVDETKSKSDYSLFTKSCDDVFIALLVYVDDIIITGNSLPEINKPNISLTSEPSETDPLIENVTEYQKLIGKLIYLTTTRPDIAYTVSCLSQFMHSPLKSHLKTTLKVIRYLKSSPGKGINVIKGCASGIDLKATQMQTGQGVLIQEDL
ncbi:ribonuclease H-like domain-containing protein [Tanacetum coccineum]